MRTPLVLILVALAGCQASDKPDSTPMRDRQDAALKDPFSYGPATAAPGMPNGRPAPEPEIKPHDDTAKGDWDRFWNP